MTNILKQTTEIRLPVQQYQNVNIDVAIFKISALKKFVLMWCKHISKFRKCPTNLCVNNIMVDLLRSYKQMGLERGRNENRGKGPAVYFYTCYTCIFYQQHVII